MSQGKVVCITSGDSDGIGLEVSTKALFKIGPKKNIRFVLFYSARKICRTDALLIKKLEIKFICKTFSSLDEALADKSISTQLLLVRCKSAPAYWVEESAYACLVGKVAVLCTGPLSKPGIKQSGLQDLGHTEILKRICGVKNANMCFIGSSFNVVLASGHQALSKVPSLLNENNLRFAIKNADFMRSYLAPALREKPLGILSLNPHAGDNGLIGDFEKNLLSPLLISLSKEGIKTSAPLVPDVAFHPSNWKRFSFYVALYHDQGLIPFKLIHGFNSGVHLTLGLPICRTSVDHGTAKDLYGKNQADPGSMNDALLWAIKLARAGGWKGNTHV